MRNNTRAGVLLGVGLAAAAGLQCGCSSMGYNLGSMLPPEIQTIFVPTVVNKSMQPLLEADTTQAIIQEIQRDGSLEIASEQNADSKLKVVITNYRIVPIAFETARATATEEYRIFITASFVATRAIDGSVIAESAWVQGDATTELIGDLTAAKEKGLPLAARDLARNIVTSIVEYW